MDLIPVTIESFFWLKLGADSISEATFIMNCHERPPVAAPRPSFEFEADQTTCPCSSIHAPHEGGSCKI